MTSDMDLDLADYDQVDEAEFFMGQRLGLEGQASRAGSLPFIVTLSSSCDRSGSGGEEANCENDFVFLPPAPTGAQTRPTQSPKQMAPSQLQQTSSKSGGSQGQSDEADERSVPAPPTSLPLGSKQQQEPSREQAARASHPLMTISPNAAGSGAMNPFYNLHQMSPDGASSQAYQPFWMRPESYASKPIGLLEANLGNSCSPSHLSDLMHQIITKSDSIYIAIPCAYCPEPKACPPSDISAWLNHMNRAHNCKVCPICNKLVGLGPMRDLEIMRKHVVSHIDDEWLERRSAKTNFSFGLQQQWFAGSRCNVKNPRSIGANYKS